jgi:hypothetical protein
MASEKPLPDRCGAHVTDRVGVEVTDDELGRTFSDEDDLERLIIDKGAVTAHKDPEYTEVVSHLKHGFNLTAVDLAPNDADQSDDDAYVRVQIVDDDPYIRHRTTELDGYCERYPMEDRDRCYVHTGLSTDEENPTPNRMKHGLHALRSDYYKQLGEQEKVAVQALVDSWLDNAPFDRDNFAKVNEVWRIAVDQMRLWKSQDEFTDTDAGGDSGLLEEITIDYDPETKEEITTTDENPVNLPYDRLDRTTIRKAKDLGLLDDPETQEAEAKESLAEKFADLAE